MLMYCCDIIKLIVDDWIVVWSFSIFIDLYKHFLMCFEWCTICRISYTFFANTPLQYVCNPCPACSVSNTRISLMSDWALTPHNNAYFKALEGKEVVIRSAANNKYLRYGVRSPDPKWDCSWRGMFEVPQLTDAAGKIIRPNEPECKFIVVNNGAGFFLKSVATGKRLQPFYVEAVWRLVANAGCGWELAPSQYTRVDPPTRFLADYLENDANEPAVLPDGNYCLKSPMFAASDDAGTNLSQERIRDWDKKPGHRMRFLATSWGFLIAASEIGFDGGSIRDWLKDGTLSNPNHQFYIETLVPPDAHTWTDVDDHKLACCLNAAGYRTETSCSDGATDWSRNVSQCDRWMEDWCSRNRDSPKCACFKVRDDINEDPYLRDYGPLAACSGSCSSNEQAYKTATMRLILSGSGCAKACININTVKDKALVDNFNQNCTINTTTNTSTTTDGDTVVDNGSKTEIDNTVTKRPPKKKPSNNNNNNNNNGGNNNNNNGGNNDGGNNNNNNNNNGGASNDTLKNVAIVVGVVAFAIAAGVLLRRSSKRNSGNDEDENKE